ncbi:MAG: hypothetical protein GXO75_14975 [Calditrichaeota bacterium]|nr:hypothetical protein [Calditrichota bacterium]
MMKKSIFSIFSVIFLFNSFLFAATGEWETFTNAQDIRQFVLKDSLIWCATNGGVLRFSTNTFTFSKFTNTDGLENNDVLAITGDERGNIWAALENGIFHVYDPEAKSWAKKTHYRDQVISQLYPYGDSIFVAFKEGVSLFVKNENDPQGWEVKETYYIGESRKIVIADRKIWVALAHSIKRANLDFPNLQAPSAWSTFTSADGLPGSEIFTIFEFQNTFVAGTDSGISFFDGSTWSAAELRGTTIKAFTDWNDHLVAGSLYDVHQKSDNGTWEKLGPDLRNVDNLGVDDKNKLWAGMRDNGLARFDEDNFKWEKYLPNGPVENKFNALAFDHNGNLWAASNIGISRFDGVTWRTFSKTDGLDVGSGYQTLAVDSDNRVWAGNWGGGIAIFDNIENDSYKISAINNQSGKLAGIQINPNYVVITGLRLDSRGNMWILNYLADNKQVVAVVDPDDNWQYFSTLDGISSIEVRAIAFDNDGRKWIGTEDNGITVLDDKNTPFDKSDDDLSQGLKKEDGLESEHIRSLAMDFDGVMWIATPEGLNYWFDGQVFVKYGTINDDINCILVDAGNNKWIGTSGGLTMLHADGFQMTHYTTSNSPLPADNVTSFAFDEKSGDIYIGTTNGLSRLRTPFTKPAATLSFLKGYPNPFILKGPESFFTIDNLAKNSAVNIYTAEGFLVKSFPKDQILGSRVVWDGCNDKGDQVASGVFIYLVTTEKGLSKSGKVAVIKP